TTGRQEVGRTAHGRTQAKTGNVSASSSDDAGETEARKRRGAEGETTPEALRQKDLIIETLWREALTGPPKGNRRIGPVKLSGTETEGVLPPYGGNHLPYLDWHASYCCSWRRHH